MQTRVTRGPSNGSESLPGRPKVYERAPKALERTLKGPNAKRSPEDHDRITKEPQENHQRTREKFIEDDQKNMREITSHTKLPVTNNERLVMILDNKKFSWVVLIGSLIKVSV